MYISELVVVAVSSNTGTGRLDTLLVLTAVIRTISFDFVRW